MAKSTRRVQRGRSDVITVFSPRTSGPWHLLAPLHSRVGFAVLLIATAIGAMYCTTHGESAAAWLIVVTAGVLFVFSFALLWLLIGLVVRGRAELTAIAGLVGVDAGLHLVMSPMWAEVTMVSTLVLALAVPVTNRMIMSRIWCVIDRHRLRMCLRQAKVRTMNMDGALPFMLWARPTKTGERVWLWVRAGSSAGDIEDALEYIAPACYAREARVVPVRKVSTLLAVEIIRRDPLGTKESVTSPLAKLTSLVKGTVATEGTEPITPARVVDITSTPVPASRLPDYPGTPQRKTSKKTATIEPPSSGVMVNGEDLTDYID